MSLALGIPPTQNHMTAAELIEWVAFERVWGPVLVHERVEMMIAQLCSLLASTPQKRYKPEDFLPRYEGRRKTPEQMIDLLRSKLADHR